MKNPTQIPSVDQAPVVHRATRLANPFFADTYEQHVEKAEYWLARAKVCEPKERTVLLSYAMQAICYAVRKEG